MSWNPIVVGVDASPEAAQAAAFAAAAAQRAATTCQLVHAVRDPFAALPVPESDRYRHALCEQARAQVTAALGDAVPQALRDALAVRLGPTPQVLHAAVTALGAELVVLGGKHHSALGRWLGGSTSLNVARTTRVPVLVTVGPVAVRRVLAAVDTSAAARPTLAAAERYAGLFGARLRALSVLEPVPVVPEVTPPDATEFYRLIETALERDVWPLLRPGAERIVRHGLAVETILREAVEWHADLLVVGSHGRGWTERLLVGSVTERLLNHLPTSLLVVPAGTLAAKPAGQQEPERAAATAR
jgi:nucleotide-binding universal stress UspA family protein